MKFYPNVKTLRLIDVSHAIRLYELQPQPKIEDIEVLVSLGASAYMDKFFHYYRDIKSLTIYVNNTTHIVVFKDYLQRVRNLKKLEAFSIESLETLADPYVIAFNNKIYFSLIKDLGDSLKLLKKLHCHIVFTNVTRFNMNHQFVVFSYFKSVKLLSIEIDNFAQLDLNCLYREMRPLNFDAFRGLDSITHLDIEIKSFNQPLEIEEDFLNYIEENLPNLVRFILFNKIKANVITITRLSQLKFLQELYLNLSDQTPANVRQLIKTTLIEKCKYIKKIELT